MRRFLGLVGLAAFATAAAALPAFLGEARSADKPVEGALDLLQELKTYPHKLVYETNRDGNWELYICNADGSNPKNLTKTQGHR